MATSAARAVASWIEPHLAEPPSPAAACRLFYVLSAAAVLALAAMPASARQLLMAYGPRVTPTTAAGTEQQQRNPPSSPPPPTAKGFSMGLIAWATSVGKVPHAWFTHFYVLSVAASAFWGAQLLAHGRVLQSVARWQSSRGGPAMTANQVWIAWSLMALQGARRLFECLYIMRPSSSRMWFPHWALGIGFYLCTSIGVWVEGSGKSDSQLLEQD